MVDMEHEEWLENREARKAASKKSSKPPVAAKKAGDKKRDEINDDQDGRMWRGEAA